ncbi:MAG: LCP family protein [bacterium]
MSNSEKKLKIACLIVSILIALSLSIFIYQLIPKSTIEISSKNSYNQTDKERANILTQIPDSISNQKNKSNINILILGRPGQGYPGQNLTDTIILAQLKLNEESNKKAVLISLPRDLLIRVPEQNYLTKINSLYGLTNIKTLKEKIEEITGLPIDYHIIVDLTATKEIVDLVDGLNVLVPQDINDPFFPGPNYSYDPFIISAGWRYLDGETALKYIRTRYTSPNGDFDRMARQQQVINLLKQKVLALNILWDFPTYLKIFKTLKNHIETDLSVLEMKTLWQEGQKININQIISLVIDKKETELLTGNQIMLGSQTASVVWPKAGQENYIEIKEYIKKY